MHFSTSRSRLFPFLVISILLLVLAGLVFLFSGPAGWRYADLRLVQLPTDGETGPQVIAAYARTRAQTIDVRLDFMSLPKDQNLTIYLVMGPMTFLPGNDVPGLALRPDHAWKSWIKFAEQGAVTSFNSENLPMRGFIQRVRRDAEQENITLTIDRRLAAKIRGALWLQAFILQPGSNEVASHTQLFFLSGDPPEPAKIFFAFWDAFPSATPSQLLRRWDGAHTGPFGQRHGLSQLLSASQEFQIPITLLDLKKPESLAALDYVGGLTAVRTDELLTLPDLAYGDPAAIGQSLALTRRISTRYQLLTSPFYYGPLPPPAGTSFLAGFANLPVPSPVIHWRELYFLPLPQPPASGLSPEQIPGTSMQGLNAALKLQLLQMAAHGSPDAVVYPIGGDLAQSPWADSIVARLSFAYIAAHPWIQVLSAQQLLELPSSDPPAGFDPAIAQANQFAEDAAPPVSSLGLPYPGVAGRASFYAAVRSELANAAPGPLVDQAWKVFFRLTTPAADPQLTALQTNYLGVIGHLLAASRWSAQPSQIADCSQDVDWDGLSECILANQDLFLVLEPDGARLAFAAARDKGQVFQLVGLVSQFAVGLTDPSAWRPDLGPAGDPDEVAGAFVDAKDAWNRYSFEVFPGLVVFTNPQSQATKSYSLATRRISFEYRSPDPQALSSIFVLDPSRLEQPGWGSAYLSSSPCGPSCWQWQVIGGPTLRVTANAGNLTPTTFLASRPIIRAPENPNITYPPGHFLPFPLARLDLQPETNLKVDLYLLPAP